MSLLLRLNLVPQRHTRLRLAALDRLHLALLGTLAAQLPSRLVEALPRFQLMAAAVVLVTAQTSAQEAVAVLA